MKAATAMERRAVDERVRGGGGGGGWCRKREKFVHVYTATSI